MPQKKRTIQSSFKMARVARFTVSVGEQKNSTKCTVFREKKNFYNKFKNKPIERATFVERRTCHKKKRTIQSSFKMARVARFELATFWFVAKRSIQLGYTRMCQIINLFTPKIYQQQTFFSSLYFKINSVTLFYNFLSALKVFYKIEFRERNNYRF